MIGSRRIILFGSSYNPRRALGSDLIAWWDADSRYWGANGNMTISTGVSSWKDIVGAFDAAQATGSAQPVFSSTSFNGGPGITFDGSDDQLMCNSAAFTTAMAGVLGTNGSEIWALVSQDLAGATAGAQYVGGYGPASSVQGRNVGRVGSGGVNRTRIQVGDGAANVFGSGTVVDFSGRHACRVQFGATASNFYMDGTLDPTLNVVPSTAITLARIGTRNDGTGFWGGIVVAFLITNPLSASKAAGLQSWLISRRRP